MDARAGGRTAKEPKPRSLMGHKGEVRCLVLAEGLGAAGKGAALSGAADRTIKMWDLDGACDPRGGSTLQCVQTLYGHGGTVLALDFCESNTGGLLLSSSTDGTLCVWRRDVLGQELLRFPTYSVRQRIGSETFCRPGGGAIAASSNPPRG